MEQYISKSVVVAEIEKLENVLSDPLMKINGEDYINGGKKIIKEMKSFLNTLEVKEVDLDEDVDRILEEFDWKYDKIDFYEFAKHFFELGLQARTDKELVEEVYSHIDSIKDTADRMTSGNFMHNRAAIKFSANTIAKVLELMGLKAQKGE